MKSVFFMQICKMQYVHFLQKQKTANSAAHLRPGRDTQPNNEVHLASVPPTLPASLPSQTAKRIWRPSSNTSGNTPQPNSKAHLASLSTTSGIAPQPNSKVHLASLSPNAPSRKYSPAKQHRAFGVRLSPPPVVIHCRRGCPPRGPRRGNVNRGMKSLNRYAPLGAHL